MWKWVMKNRVLTLMLFEVVVFLLYAAYVFATYSDREIVFTDDDMQVMDINRNVSPGTYLDTSYESAKAVVSPAFSLDKGIYYITADYRGNGIIKAGLIYDADRNRSELVEGNEFFADSEEESISYRVKIVDNSPVRFKIRLTGDAVDGDYVQLLSVQVVSSGLTYVYYIVLAAFLLCFIDLLIYGYFKCYKRLSSERQLIFIILSLTAFFMGLPLYQRGLAEAIDLTFHLQRIEGVYLGLLSGRFPVKIQPGWLDGNGYAASVFYGDIFLYFPAVLRMVGFTVQEAYKIYAEVVNIATVWIAFYSFRKMTKDDLAAMTGAVLYACSAKRLHSIYIAMVGEYSGMMFYPLIIAGFYLLFTEDVKSKEYKKLWILLTVGFSGLLMTHLVGCLMVGLFSFLACLLMIRRVIRRETILELCKAVSVSVLVNLWFLVPFLQYMRTENLHINGTLNRTAADSDYYSILADYTQDGQNFYELFTKQDTIGYAILFVLLVYLVTIPLQKKSLMTKILRNFFLYTIFVFWVCMIYFPTVKLAEKSMVILRYFLIIQHQERFLCVAVAMAASFGALFVAAKVLRKEVLYLFVGLLCCVNLYQTLQYFTTVETEAVYLDGIDLYAHLHIHKGPYDYGIVNAEYLPVVTDTHRLTKEIQADEMLQVVDWEREYLTYDMTVINETDQERSILLPILYYSGYQSYDLQNKAQLQTAAGSNGCVEVIVPAGYSGTFRMAFHEPWFWRMAEVISLLTLGFVLYYGKCHGVIISMKNKSAERRLRKKMEIKKITDPAFRKYGRVVQGIDFSDLVEALKKETPLPEDVAYEPSIAALEATRSAKELQRRTYGELPIEVGYCNGHNYKLNAVEYHRSSEINVAATDAVLILGMQQDITDDFTYDTSKMEAFLVPEGTAVEIYATTLHYAPCSANEGGFKVGIVLPAGTNYPLDEKHEGWEDSLITAQNKWLIGHAEGGLDAGAHIGLVGKNLDIRE